MTDKPQYLVGLDLGSRTDHSAICVLQKRFVDETMEEPDAPPAIIVNPPSTPFVAGQVAQKAPPAPRTVSCYDCQLLQRFDLHTPYPEVVERVAGLFQRPELRGQTLVVDWTGPGVPVVDMFREARKEPVKCWKCRGEGGEDAAACLTCIGRGKITLEAQIRPIYITAGERWTVDGQGFKVAKRELVSVFHVLLQADPIRLRIDPRMPMAKVFVEEMNNFRVKRTAAGNDTWESWRERQHDDLVLAAAIALWYGERASRKFWVR